MAENTDEENLENLANTQPKNPPEEIIPADETVPINSNQETENMEIHAQELHKAPGHGVKHYLFEFLMLFFAVTLGYFVENQREQIVEHERAKVFAANLLEELKKDTSGISETIKDIKYDAEKLDSFCTLCSVKEKANISNGTLYYYASHTTSINFYASENTTIAQLKSSGNLRIMGNDISQKIGIYEKQLNSLDNEYLITRPEFAKLEELYFKIFDGYTTELLRTGDKNELTDSVFKLNIPFVNDDPKLLKEFTGWTKFEVTIYLAQIKDHLLPIKQTAIELMDSLKKKYHLE